MWYCTDRDITVFAYAHKAFSKSESLVFETSDGLSATNGLFGSIVYLWLVKRHALDMLVVEEVRTLEARCHLRSSLLTLAVLPVDMMQLGYP
jgi:hypothetical protein